MDNDDELIELYNVIEDNTIFNEKKLCKNCPILCSRDKKWHWLLSKEAERLKEKMEIEKQYDSFFFDDGLCPLLINTKCSIYSDRPLECRLSPISLNYLMNNIFWIIDIECPYYLKYKNNSIFWEKINLFISTIESYFTKEIIDEIIKISVSIDRFDPLIENKDYKPIRIFQISNKSK